MTTLDWSTFADEISGDVILPESPGYESARKPAIANFHDAHPQAVVLCETPDDVAGTILFAKRFGLQVAPRSGGHCFAGRSSTDGVVIDVSPMRSVSVAEGVASVGTGARLGDVYDALDGHGLTIPAGCGPDVGISGLTLGGGLGILGRKHGLTSDSLISAQVVLADGSVVWCDEHREADLFWALRGAGGGNFGVVTALVFRVLPAPDATAFRLVWPFAHASDVIDAWQDWSPVGPDELAASLLFTAPSDPGMPPQVNLFGAMVGAESETERLLEEFVVRAGAHPASASMQHGPYRDIKRELAEHGPGDHRPNGHQLSKSEYFRRPLPTEAIAALVEYFAEDRVAGQSRELDFTPWGGAYNRLPAEATAFVHRDELFLLKHAATIDPDTRNAEQEVARSWLSRSWATVRPWGTGGVYPNFPDPDLVDWARAYHGGNLERLAGVKARYDPDGLFRFHQSIPRRVHAANTSTSGPPAT